MRDYMTAADRLQPHNKLERALRYLRTESSVGYCLDKRVGRLPAPQRQPTVLDRWIASRRGA